MIPKVIRTRRGGWNLTYGSHGNKLIGLRAQMQRGKLKKTHANSGGNTCHGCLDLHAGGSSVEKALFSMYTFCRAASASFRTVS